VAASIREHDLHLVDQEWSTAMNKTFLLAAACLAFSPLALAQSAGPTDAQVAAIVLTANQVDIDAGKLAVSRSDNKDVKEFAQRMVTDHTGVNKAATELATRLEVKPEDNATSKSLKQGGDRALERLKALKGHDFDRRYVDNEVTYHQAVLDALDKTLIPAAKNGELKALLVKVRPAFAAHLEHARHLQTALGN
jgi:putative membrane protein